jgi:hypothetical protein
VRIKKNRIAREQALATGPSRILEAAGPSTPVFTEDDLPSLPIVEVAPKPVFNTMSYALVTAVIPPSATAVVHVHPNRWMMTVSAAREPMTYKWKAASRCYEDSRPG